MDLREKNRRLRLATRIKILRRERNDWKSLVLDFRERNRWSPEKLQRYPDGTWVLVRQPPIIDDQI